MGLQIPGSIPTFPLQASSPAPVPTRSKPNQVHSSPASFKVAMTFQKIIKSRSFPEDAYSKTIPDHKRKIKPRDSRGSNSHHGSSGSESINGSPTTSPESRTEELRKKNPAFPDSWQPQFSDENFTVPFDGAIHIRNRILTSEFLKRIKNRDSELRAFSANVPRNELHQHEDGSLPPDELLNFLEKNKYLLAPDNFNFSPVWFEGGISHEVWAKDEHFREQFRTLITLNGKKNPRNPDDYERRILTKKGHDYGIPEEWLKGNCAEFFAIFQHIEDIRLQMPTADQLYPVLKGFFGDCSGHYLELLLELQTPDVPKEFIDNFPSIEELVLMEKKEFPDELIKKFPQIEEFLLMGKNVLCEFFKQAEKDLEPWIQSYVKKYSVEIDKADIILRNKLRVDLKDKLNGNTLEEPFTDPKSPIHTKFNIQIMRTQEIAKYVAEAIAAAHLIQGDQGDQEGDDRFLGITNVGPEHTRKAQVAYFVQKELLRYLYERTPAHVRPLNFSLHAGELCLHNSSKEIMKNRIRDAIDTYAKRIGHGTCLGSDPKLPALLIQARKLGIYFEICLTSNFMTLGTKLSENPLLTLLTYNVPCGLSSDDPSILNTDAVEELMKAIKVFDLSWNTIIRMTRDSIQFSFLSGESIWEQPEEDGERYMQTKPLFNNIFDVDWTPSHEQTEFFNCSEKAQTQILIERKILKFEEEHARNLEEEEIVFSPKMY